MSSFEFFTVLLSFVVSLGVASLLMTVTRLIQDGARVKFSLTYALWAAAIFQLQIIYWVKAWSYHEHFALKISTSIPPLTLAILAFLACGLATPQTPEEGQIDLKAFHDRQGRKYQIAYAAFLIGAIAQGYLMSDIATARDDLTNDTIFLALSAALAIACAIWRRAAWLQLITPILFLITGAAYLYRLIEQ